MYNLVVLENSFVIPTGIKLADVLLCFNVSNYPCPSVYIVDFYYTRMCFDFLLIFYFSCVL